jgi:hypothetical protein
MQRGMLVVGKGDFHLHPPLDQSDSASNSKPPSVQGRGRLGGAGRALCTGVWGSWPATQVERPTCLAGRWQMLSRVCLIKAGR